MTILNIVPPKVFLYFLKLYFYEVVEIFFGVTISYCHDLRPALYSEKKYQATFHVIDHFTITRE